MEGMVMRKLADALGDIGFVIKKIEEEAYGQYDRPESGEKYTGEIIITIRPTKDEEADIEKSRSRKEAERTGSKSPAPTMADGEGVSF